MYYGDDPDAGKLLRVPELGAHWRGWVQHLTVWHLDEEIEPGEH